MLSAVAARSRQQGTRKGALCVLFACTLLAAGSARAQGSADPADVMAAFPPGSIDSAARADAALVVVDRERRAQEDRYAQARKVCYEKFLAEQCLSEARLQNIHVTSRIRDVELEAKSVKRTAELRELDQARDARNREAQAEAVRRQAEAARKRAERGTEGEAEQAGKARPEDAASRAARAREARERAAARAQARARKEQEARDGAAERAERARRHEEMVRETLERAERRARAEEKKAAEKRAAAAQTPAGR